MEIIDRFYNFIEVIYLQVILNARNSKSGVIRLSMSQKLILSWSRNNYVDVVVFCFNPGVRFRSVPLPISK